MDVSKQHNALVEHFLSMCDSLIKGSEYPDDTRSTYKKRLFGAFMSTFSNSVSPNVRILHSDAAAEEFLKASITTIFKDPDDIENIKACIDAFSNPDKKDRDIFKTCVEFLIALSTVELPKHIFNEFFVAEEKNDRTGRVICSSLPALPYQCYAKESFERDFSLNDRSFQDLQNIFDLEPGVVRSKITSGNGFFRPKTHEERCITRMQNLMESQPNILLSPLSFNNIDFTNSSSSSSAYNSYDSSPAVVTPEEPRNEHITFPSYDELLSLDEIKFGPLSWEKRGSLPTKENLRYFTECCSEVFDFAFNGACISIRGNDDCISSLMINADEARCVMIGRPCETFSVPHHGEISVKKRVSGLTRKSFESVVSHITGLAKVYRNMSSFSKEEEFDDCVTKMLRRGLHEFLLCYEYSIEATDVKDLQAIDCIDNIFYLIAENIRSVAEICGISEQTSLCSKLCTGTELVSYLYNAAEESFYSDSNVGAIVGVWLLIKHAFSPFLSFLNEWLFEGKVNEDLEELHLCIDYNYIMDETELYWKKCYKSNTGHIEDIFPVFLRSFSSDIFLCGKSYNLLKRCSPQHPLFSVYQRSPCLQLSFCEEDIMKVHKMNCDALLEQISCIKKFICDAAEKPDAKVFAKRSQKSCRDLNKWLDQQLVSLEELSSCFPSFEEDYEDSGSLAEEFPQKSFLCSELKNIRALEPIFEKVKLDELLNGKAVAILIAALGKHLSESADLTDEKVSLVVQYLQEKPISYILSQCITPLILTQIELVNKCTLHYLFTDSKLIEHFKALSSVFFLRDGEFARGISERLLNQVSMYSKPRDLLNFPRLSAILQLALSDSAQLGMYYEELLGLRPVNVPAEFPKYTCELTNHVVLEYDISWPCNIIINDESMLMYNMVFGFMLRVRYAFSRLSAAWLHLKRRTAEVPEIASSPQFVQLQQCRHTMQHFMYCLQAHISHEIHEVLWNRFQTDILDEIKNLEEVIKAHRRYISQAVEICLLRQKTYQAVSPVRAVLKSVCGFCDHLISKDWNLNISNGKIEHEAYSQLIEENEKFLRASKILYELSRCLFYEKNVDHFESFMILVNYNYYFHSKSASVF